MGFEPTTVRLSGPHGRRLREGPQLQARGRHRSEWTRHHVSSFPERVPELATNLEIRLSGKLRTVLVARHYSF